MKIIETSNPGMSAIVDAKGKIVCYINPEDAARLKLILD